MKKTKITLVLVAVAFVFSIGFFIYDLFDTTIEPGSDIKVVLHENERSPDSGIFKVEEVRKEPIEEEFPLDMEERLVQRAVHRMSHQKVYADKKWGALLITEERIERLLEVVNTNKTSYNHASIYIDILERWKEGDFSRADKDHNAIWDLQGGTIGRATRILDNKEEQDYIEETFKIVE